MIEELRPEDTTEIPPPPGLRLKTARQAQGIEQIDVAREMKLDLALIDALERGDIDSLPQPVYTAGYIRSYAKLMDLPADQLVADYVSMETKDLPVLPDSPEKLPERYRRVAEALPKSFSIAAANSRNKATVQYSAIALGFLVVVIAIWQSVSLMSGDESSEVDVAAMIAKDMPVDTFTQVLPTAGVKIQNPAPISDKKISGTVDQSDSVDLANTKVERSETIKYVEKRLTLKKLQTEGDGPGGEALALLQKQNATDLKLTFKRTSWVEIKDATGKRLVRQLGIAGNTRKISGIAPFQVLLGNGHGVSIEYNGKEVDFSAYQRDTVARFTLEVPKEIKLN